VVWKVVQIAKKLAVIFLPVSEFGRHVGSLADHRSVVWYFFANVRDHRWLPVARPMPGEERAQAWSVARVAIR
jgi:hypothetical protein